MQIDINIDDYLSEQEKKEFAIEAFKEHIKAELFKSTRGTVQSDSEVQRIIGNITSDVVFKAVSEYIPNYKELIVEKTLKALQKDDYSYYVFKKKDVWDKEESPAVKYMNEVVRNSKDAFQKRIKDTIANYDMSKEVAEQISNEFSEMSDNLYKLSDLLFNLGNK